MDKNNIIFLNTDSIIIKDNSVVNFYNKNEQNINCLEYVLQSVPNIKVVITSPWAIGKKYDFFIEYLHMHNTYNLYKSILQYLHFDYIISPFEEGEPCGASVDFWIARHVEEVGNYLCIDNYITDYLEWNPILLIDNNTGFCNIDGKLANYYFSNINEKNLNIFYLNTINNDISLTERKSQFLSIL